MDYISGRDAMLLMGITTRQRLNQIVRKHNISFKNTGVGMPNIYLKSDVEAYVKLNTKPPKPPKDENRVIKTRRKKVKVEKVVRKKKTKAEATKEITTIKDNLSTVEENNKRIKQGGFLNSDPLNETGREHFNYLREKLIEDGTYNEKDIGILQSYCVSYQKYIHAINASNDELDTTIDSFGNVKISPYFLVADKCLSQMTKLAGILGIGARSRVGLPIKEPKKESVFDILNVKEEF